MLSSQKRAYDLDPCRKAENHHRHDPPPDGQWALVGQLFSGLAMVQSDYFVYVSGQYLGLQVDILDSDAPTTCNFICRKLAFGVLSYGWVRAQKVFPKTKAPVVSECNRHTVQNRVSSRSNIGSK